MSATVAMLRGLSASVVIGTMLVSCSAKAEQTRTMPRIGVLTAPYASVPANEGLSKGLRELGYIEDESIVIERRSGGTQEELRAAAADLARSKVDAIVVFSTPAASAAMATTLPVVFLVGDPVSTGLAATLARPGGNATGVALIYTELIAKRLEILRLLAPGTRRIGCLMNSSNPASVLQVEAAQKAAQALGLELVMLDARSDAEVDAVVRALSRSAVDGILVTGDLVLFANKAKLAGAIREAGLPAIFPSREWHGDGELISYAPSISEAGRKMAVYVDKILKGARPADLPVEQLSKYELVINLRVAQELGLKVPQELLLSADEVIR
jgi:putative ABC transport system substrate-binding protein